MKLIASTGVLMLLADGTFLLQHRDNRPGIFYPGKVGLFGGEIETGETPVMGAIREIREELSIDIDPPLLFNVLSLDSNIDFRFRRRYFYVANISEYQHSKITLREGQGIVRINANKIDVTCSEFVPYDLGFILEFIEYQNITK